MNKKKNYELVIVESPAKAKTIGQFLGEGFVVKSSYGHICDLKKNNDGVEIENNFKPVYIVPDDKKAVLGELKSLAKKANSVWLASDEDREGEAISWHLAMMLGLDIDTTKRIVFHEITKTAILEATKHPRTINMDLVNAQQARRVLDRLVGFELSPVLWRKVKRDLSAGRVQSVAVRILVEREREIFAFKSRSEFATSVVFGLNGLDGKTYKLAANLNTRYKDIDSCEAFIASCSNADFAVSNVDSKMLTRQPAPPFTTSTLQQEASRKLGMSVSQTMQTAQSLYEAGHITYMRTDSVNLSETALKASAAVINEMFSKEFYQRRQFRTQSKGAQEAHEAIRPTYINQLFINGTPQEERLYRLIWQRTVASQMADAQIERTSISIDTPDEKAKFVASADVIKFDGFMKLYMEGNDNDESEEEDVASLPGVAIGDKLHLMQLSARERWTQRPSRFNEAALVKELERLGIGRPSTYAPTISTIQNRGYVIKDSRDGVPRVYRTLALDGSTVVRSEATENTGVEKNKLFPTDIAMLVTDFLVEHFNDVMSYDFTAKVEQQFDEIASGDLVWQDVIGEFYRPFHSSVSDTLEHSEKSTGERLLGVDPVSGKNVYVRIGRFGPMAQIGETTDEKEKPRFSSLKKDQHIETIGLEEALRLFELPRRLGEFEGKTVTIGTGRFGPYVYHDSKYVSLKKDDDPMSITLEEAIERIEAKRIADQNKTIKVFDENPDVKIMNGRWGAYIVYGKLNVRVPKTLDASKLSLEQCLELCDKQTITKKETKKETTKAKTTKKESVSDEPKKASKGRTSKKTETK